MNVFGAALVIGACVTLHALQLIDAGLCAALVGVGLIALRCCAFDAEQVQKVSGRGNSTTQVGEVWVD